MSFQDILGGPSAWLSKTTTTKPVPQSPRQKSNPKEIVKKEESPARKSDVGGRGVAPVTAVTPERSAEFRRAPPQSRYGKLNEEITHIQTMVRQLEILVRQCGESPENQWRLRILLQSAQESDRELGVKIREFRLTLGSIKDRAVRSSRAKLIRDYERVHGLFTQVSEEYQTRQLQAVSQFSGSHNTNMTPQEFQKRLAAREQEDFFERAMREREAEVSNINHSMHRVNEIYNELGNIIESQKEVIDRISLHVDDGKWNTRAGLHHLEKANMSLFQSACGSITDVVSDDDEKRSPPPPPSTQTTNATRKRSRRKKSGAARAKQDEFRWTMPFETIGDDMMEVVNKDILGLGKDVISTSQRKLKSAGGMLSCTVPMNANNEAGVDTSPT